MTDFNVGAPPSAPPEAASSKPSPKWVPWTIGGIGGLIVGVTGTLGLMAALGALAAVTADLIKDVRFADAVAACGGESLGMELADGSTTLVFDMKGEDDPWGASYEDYLCLRDELEMPTRIHTHVGQTTSMDGRQQASWDGIVLSWSYHPDRGLDGVFEFQN